MMPLNLKTELKWLCENITSFSRTLLPKVHRTLATVYGLLQVFALGCKQRRSGRQRLVAHRYSSPHCGFSAWLAASNVLYLEDGRDRPSRRSGIALKICVSQLLEIHVIENFVDVIRFRASKTNITW